MPRKQRVGQMMVVTALGGTVHRSLLHRLLDGLPTGAKTCLVELPDFGVPKLAHELSLGQAEDWSTERDVQQWMLDVQQNRHRDVDHYLIEYRGIHLMALHPSVSLVHPVVPFALEQQTLISLPLYLKLRLTPIYDYVIVVTQGTFSHPLTHFAMRCADVLMLYSTTPLELMQHEQLKQALVLDYQGEAARFFHIAASPKSVKGVDILPIKIEDVISQAANLLPLPLFWRSDQTIWVPPIYPSGLLRPEDYRHYAFDQADLERWQIRLEPGQYEAGVQQLSFDLILDQAGAARVRIVDTKYEAIKRYICEHGYSSTSALHRRFNIRRQRVINILKELADEGVLHRPSKHIQSYTLRWTPREIQTYLAGCTEATSVFKVPPS